VIISIIYLPTFLEGNIPNNPGHSLTSLHFTFIYDNHRHLVEDSLDWWFENGFLRISADAIGRKMGTEYFNQYGLFIDCRCSPTSVVGGGLVLFIMVGNRNFL
jgi:hypothetical protein